MEPQVTSSAISYSEAAATSGFVAIAVGINKKAEKADFNPSLDAYKDICADPTYALLLNPAFLNQYNVLYNIQMPEKDDFVSVRSYFGFIAQHKTSGNCVIAFRGTQTPFEALKDEDFIPALFREYGGNYLVPQGFYHIFEEGQIVSLPDAKNPITPVPLSEFAATLVKRLNLTDQQLVTVTGHSLGAAVATYFAAVTTNSLLQKRLKLSLCTFASPMTGDSMFTSKASSSIFESVRIYNAEDKVPNLPVWRDKKGNNIYTHVTGGLRIDSTNNPNINHDPKTGCAHQLPVYRYLLEQLNDNDNPDIISAADDARCRVQQ